MKFQGEITKVTLQKKGVKLEIFIESEDKGSILNHISNFVEMPITHEVLIDEETVVSEFGTITDEQRKKVYALIGDYAREYGELDAEFMKDELKGWFCESQGYPSFSLSTVSKDIASDFIEYIINLGRENGFAFAFKEGDKDDEPFRMDMVNRICSACGKAGALRRNSKMKMICLCDEHFEEFKLTGEEFLNKYHLKLIEY